MLLADARVQARDRSIERELRGLFAVSASISFLTFRLSRTWNVILHVQQPPAKLHDRTCGAYRALSDAISNFSRDTALPSRVLRNAIRCPFDGHYCWFFGAYSRRRLRLVLLRSGGSRIAEDEHKRDNGTAHTNEMRSMKKGRGINPQSE